MTRAYRDGFTAAMTLAETKDHFGAKTAVVELNYDSETSWREAYIPVGQLCGYHAARLTYTTAEYFFAGITIRFKWDGIKKPQQTPSVDRKAELNCEKRERMIEEYKRQLNANGRVTSGVGEAPSGYAASHGVGMSTRPRTELEKVVEGAMQRIKDTPPPALPKVKPRVDADMMRVAIDETVADIKRAFERLSSLKGAELN